MDFWHRLPVFRTVAETEHLPTASKRLGLTAPALSRSIKLLEESVGRPLFDREGRRIVLNPAGKAFLRVVRTAMRQVDTALDELHEAQVQQAGIGRNLELAEGSDRLAAAELLRASGFEVLESDPAPDLETIFLSLTGKALRDLSE